LEAPGQRKDKCTTFLKGVSSTRQIAANCAKSKGSTGPKTNIGRLILQPQRLPAAAAQLIHLGTLRDETTLVLLVVAGSIVYAGSILLLFGRGWLRSLVRS
jgi:hypothetical protein